MTATGKLAESRVNVWDEEEAEDIHSEKYYGKFVDDHLELAPVEAYHLVERDLLEVEREGSVLDGEELYQIFADRDEEFDYTYRVYSDLRERGLIVKSGFKFGAHFRVYPRGVNPYTEGPKKQKQHTKWVVHAVPEDRTMSFQEMSRAVRLANNIRATMLWAIVDSEGGVTYYEVDHV
ncbi:MAG: tRNA-intron lyase, partial [Candidatus Nanohaloarchaea archaeon]